MTVSGTSSKTAVKHAEAEKQPAAEWARGLLASIVIGCCGFGLVACGGEDTTSAPEVSPAASTRPADDSDLDGGPAVSIAPPELGLTPLPTVEQVRDAAPGGRLDPFAPLQPSIPETAADPDAAQNEDSAADSASDPAVDPGSGITVTGVLLVGGQSRALASNAQLSGVLCVSADGRCSGDSALLLPPGWSVVAIDVPSGCVRLAQNGTPQDPLCIS